MLDKLKTLPELRDVATDQQTGGTTLTLTIDRDQAARFGIQPQLIDDTLYDAFGQRQVTQYFTQVNSYHVIMEVLPELQGERRHAGQDLCQVADHRPAGAAVDVRELDDGRSEPLSISHQGQFPAVTISFNLAPGVALGQATEAIQHAEGELGTPASLIGTFQGNAQAFQASLAHRALLILAALVRGLHHPRHALRELHPPADDPLHPALGRRRRAAMLMLFGFDFS